MIRSKNNTRHLHQTICSRGMIVLKYRHNTAGKDKPVGRGPQ